MDHYLLIFMMEHACCMDVCVYSSLRSSTTHFSLPFSLSLSLLPPSYSLHRGSREEEEQKQMVVTSSERDPFREIGEASFDPLTNRCLRKEIVSACVCICYFTGGGDNYDTHFPASHPQNYLIIILLPERIVVGNGLKSLFLFVTYLTVSLSHTWRESDTRREEKKLLDNVFCILAIRCESKTRIIRKFSSII
jgi:hypothetical protein